MTRPILKPTALLLACLFALGGLAACENTFQGAKKDLKKADQKIQKTLD